MFGSFAAFILGLVWGSFFNVCIVRLPHGTSPLHGRSRCPKCAAFIPWKHNIPLLSYVRLRGRCFACGTTISAQYPLIELFSASLFVWLYLKFGWNLHFISYAIFLSLLLIISVIDLYHRIIPDELSLGGIVIGFVASFLTQDLAWFESVGGILVGGGIFLAISFIYEKLAKREGLGGGDVKLLAMIGAWLGIQSILTVVVCSSILGSLVGSLMILLKRGNMKSAIPFGPFLAVGALVYFLWGAEMKMLLFPTFGPE